MGEAIGILYTKANYLDSELGLDSVNALITHQKQDKNLNNIDYCSLASPPNKLHIYKWKYLLRNVRHLV